MVSEVIFLVRCHMIGDYVLQNDFIAKTKGENWYHLFVHSILYCVPFIVVFGINYMFGILFLSHIIIDSLKARYNKINYTQDQLLHYLLLSMYLL